MIHLEDKCTAHSRQRFFTVIFAIKHFTLFIYLHDIIKMCAIRGKLTCAELGQSSYLKVYPHTAANGKGDLK